MVRAYFAAPLSRRFCDDYLRYKKIEGAANLPHAVRQNRRTFCSGASMATGKRRFRSASGRYLSAYHICAEAVEARGDPFQPVLPHG